MNGMELRLAGVARDFSNRVIFRDISFTVRAREVVALRGRNGAGKTTLLNVISGILPASAGTVTVVGADRTTIGYVPQNYATSLLPWRTAFDNIALPLRFRGVSGAARARRVVHLLDSLHLSVPLDQYPEELSGGELQKVTIARALVEPPNLLLLDEPFANLDAATRHVLRETLLSHLQEQSVTVLVSHDLDDCVLLADRIIVLDGSPATISTVIDVHLPRPRTEQMLTSDAFLAARASVLRAEALV